MTHFIDRRLNPKGKSLGNRQRFLRRARTQIREAVQKSLKDTSVADIEKDRKIRISTKGTKEPRFRLDPRASGERDFVLPGNREFSPGDQIDKPKSGAGGSGKDASDSGEGEDDFEFTMTEEEVLAIDRAGNVAIDGIVGAAREAALAAKTLIVTVEEIVDALPPAMNAIVLPHWVVSAVAACPGGAYPSYAHGHYVRDNAFYRQWDAIARERASFLAWMEQHVLGTRDHRAFLAGLQQEAA